MRERRFLTVTEAAAYLRFKSKRHFHDFLHRRRKAGRPVRCFHRGKELLFTDTDLDAALDIEETKPSRFRQVG